jgi:Leucine-rich repeat (LRR) protein
LDYGYTISTLRSLDLGFNQLSGEIPSSFGDLVMLINLDLSFNQLSGSIPSSLRDLRDMTHLRLQNNQLRGSIPSFGYVIPNLRELLLCNNSLSGPVPELPSSLTQCNLSGNTELCGQKEISNLCTVGLETCSMDCRMMHAWLPKMFDDSTCCSQPGIGCINDRITDLYVSLNLIFFRTLGSLGLDGQIPESIGDLSNLIRLDLNSNNLTGEMPISIELLSRLEYLSLENNSMSGSISSSLGYLSSLRYINLNGNQLSGEIPSSLGYLYLLYELDLKHNQLSGSIPSTFGDRSVGASVLGYLSLNGNQLDGTIPSSLGDLPYVNRLGLGNNQFSGEIPSSFGDLSTLAYLSLEDNQLSGQIPQTFFKLAILKELYLAGNDLLAGLVPDIPGLIVLDITGTDLYFAQEEPTLAEIPTSLESTTDPPTEFTDENGDAQSINLITIVAVSAGTAMLAVVIGITIFVAIRRSKNNRQKDYQDECDEVQSNYYQMSEIIHSVAEGNTDKVVSDLVFISKISAGAFGVVWKGTHRGEIVAIKKMKLDKMPRGETKFIQIVIDEAKIMRDMKHDRVVQFNGFDFRTVSIIMELMSQGALSSLIKNCENTMNWSTRYQMMLDICEGMAYLHSPTNDDGTEKKELFHQDLKSANVLLIEVDGILRAKIGDFGLSRML